MAQTVVIGVFYHLQVFPGAGEGHLNNLTDVGIWTVGHQHDPVRQQ